MTLVLPKSLRWRLLAAFLLPAALLFGLAFAAGYVLTRGVLERELGQSLSGIAAATATQVNAERLMLVQEGDDKAETRTYRNFLRTLTELREATGTRRIVAFDSQGRVRVDSGGELPTGAEMPELARDRLELERVLQKGETAQSQVLFEGNDGRLYKTGYAPLRTEAGEIVGAIAVEGSAEFWRPLRQLGSAYAVFVVLTLLVLAGVAVVMARALTRPLRRLMDAAVRIGSGDLSTPVRGEDSLEIGTLARELEAMRNALESRDRQLKMMLAGVAHEVRNPIGGIELFAGLLAEELPSPPKDGSADPQAEARSHVRRIRGEIDYLKRIVEDFLVFAREQKLSRAPFEADALVRSAVELIESDAHARNVKLAVSAAPATVEGDQNLLTAAVVNLVKNAVQASASEQEVRVQGALEGGRYVIRVEDRGGGIPAEKQAQIFEPFFTTREKGTGLGLPLAQKIIVAHGGELSFQSEPGRTVFEVRLGIT